MPLHACMSNEPTTCWHYNTDGGCAEAENRFPPLYDVCTSYMEHDPVLCSISCSGLLVLDSISFCGTLCRKADTGSPRHHNAMLLGSD